MEKISDSNRANQDLKGSSLLIQSPSGNSTSNLHGTTYVWDQGLYVGDQASQNQAPLSVYGATNLNGGLTVEKNQPARLLGSLDVYGTTTLHDNLTVDKDQATTLYGSLDVYGTATLHGALTVGQDQPTTLHGPLTVDTDQPTMLGNLTLKGTLTLQACPPISAFSSDTGLSPGDNQTIPTQLAVKTYVGTQVSQINQVLSQKAALAGSTSQDFSARNLTVAGQVNAPFASQQVLSQVWEYSSTSYGESTTWASLVPDPMQITITTGQSVLYVAVYISRVQQIVANVNTVYGILLDDDPTTAALVNTGDHYGWNYRSPSWHGFFPVAPGTHTIEVKYQTQSGAEWWITDDNGQHVRRMTIMEFKQA
jgi:hypothetical protein